MNMSVQDIDAVTCPTANRLRGADLATVAGLPLFRQMSADIILRVIEGARIERHPANTLLFQQGELPIYLHIILDGQVSLSGGEAALGEDTVVAILNKGCAFIEAAVLTDQPYLMTARTLEPTRMLLLSASRLRDDLLAIPELASALLTSVSTHFRRMVCEIKELKLKTASQRLGAYFLSLTPKTEGSTIINLPHSKGLIALRVGVRRETLSRLFCTLQPQGIVVEGGLVSIADIVRLRAYCQTTDGETELQLSAGA